METQIKFHHTKIIISKKIDKNWATKISKCHNFGFSSLQINFKMQQIVVQTNTPTTRIFLSLYTYLITGGSWAKVSKTITTEFSVDGMTDRKSGAAGRPTVRQCPLPRFRAQVALRCVAGFLDARESGSLVVALVDKTRMKFEMRCLVVIPLSLPCLLDSKVTHFEWVGNRLMMKQEEAVGASDLCASSSSG